MNLFHIFSWRPGRFLKASTGLLSWLIIRALAQAALVFLMTRHFGASGYGLFVALLAISSLFTPLAGLGLHAILLRDGARSPANISKLIGNVLTLWWPSTILFSIVAFLCASVISLTTLSPMLLAVFLSAEIAATSLLDLAGRIEQSQQRMRSFGILQAGLPCARLIALLLLTHIMRLSIEEWVRVYMALSVSFTIAIFINIKNRYRPIYPTKRNWRMLREGFPFWIGSLSLRSQAEFNKPVLAHAGHAQAGNFSAAQRVLDLASLPITAMQEALWPRYFAGTELDRQAGLISFFIITLSLLISTVLSLAAPLLPLMLGADFKNSASLLFYLAWLLPFQVIRNLLSAAVVSNNLQAYLTWMYIICGITSVILNSILIARLGPLGAVWAAYAVEILAILVLFARHLPFLRLKHGR